MDKYRLKKGQPGFMVTDGLLKGRRYEPGKKYRMVPKNEASRFETIKEPAEKPEPAKQKPAKQEKEESSLKKPLPESLVQAGKGKGK